MESPRPIAHLLACCAGAGLLVAANLPHAMVGPGQWEISKTSGGGGEKICLPDPAILMQWEHRAKQCTRTIVTSSLDRAEMHYTCVGGGFGTSRVEVLTPRSIKVATQGIADGLPFGYVVHAHRVGACPS